MVDVDAVKKNNFISHRLASLYPMCMPQSNMTVYLSSSVTSTHERPTSCPAPRGRMRMREFIAIFFFEIEKLVSTTTTTTTTANEKRKENA